MSKERPTLDSLIRVLGDAGIEVIAMGDDAAMIPAEVRVNIPNVPPKRFYVVVRQPLPKRGLMFAAKQLNDVLEAAFGNRPVELHAQLESGAVITRLRQQISDTGVSVSGGPS